MLLLAALSRVEAYKLYIKIAHTFFAKHCQKVATTAIIVSQAH